EEQMPKDGRKRQFNGSSTCEQVLKGIDLKGMTIAITGTTNGIGTETARHLALAGAHVICLNRNKELTEQEIEKVREEKLAKNVQSPPLKMSFVKCDLASIASVRQAAEQIIRDYEKLDVLILNAGIYLPAHMATADGLESTFGVNHVGHFHLTTLLLPLLEKSTPSRIVIVSSEGHASSGINTSATLEEKITALMPSVEKNAGMMRALTLYCLSKLCNVLFAMKLHRNFSGKGVDVYVLHPGTMISTNIGNNMGIWASVLKVLAYPFNKTLSQGASTTVYCAVHPETKGVSGKYWESCWDDEKRFAKELGRDEQLQEELWKRTEKIIGDIEKK
ncbi:hypothetical protein PRIPAC_85301, partial [Pristionchus pacificus]